MKIRMGFLAVALALCCVCARGEEPFRAWAESEAVLAKALALRVVNLEAAMPFHFEGCWRPKVSLEWKVGSRDPAHSASAVYEPETETILFPISLTYRFNREYHKPVRLMDPRTVAKDSYFNTLADHELAHQLMDQVSRATVHRPWFTEQYSLSLNYDEALGLNVLSEGVAMYFQRMLHPVDEKLTELSFPTDERQLRTYSQVVNDGGHWLVHTILDTYGQRGLEWVVAHPFVADHTRMRAAAIAYQGRALAELAAQKDPK